MNIVVVCVVVIVVVKVFDVKLDSIGGGVVFIVVVAFILGVVGGWKGKCRRGMFVADDNDVVSFGWDLGSVSLITLGKGFFSSSTRLGFPVSFIRRELLRRRL